MQLMDEILSNTSLDRMARIDKLEAILSAATLLPSDQVRLSTLLIYANSNKYFFLCLQVYEFAIIARYNVLYFASYRYSLRPKLTINLEQITQRLKICRSFERRRKSKYH